MDNVTIELTDPMMVLGEVSLNREVIRTIRILRLVSCPCPSQQPRWRNNCSMEEEVDDLGRFDMLLPVGNWSFTLDAGEMSSNSVTSDQHLSRRGS